MRHFIRDDRGLETVEWAIVAFLVVTGATTLAFLAAWAYRQLAHALHETSGP